MGMTLDSSYGHPVTCAINSCLVSIYFIPGNDWECFQSAVGESLGHFHNSSLPSTGGA